MPAIQQIWRNGIVGNWFGNTISLVVQPGYMTATTIDAVDNVNGDTKGLSLYSTTSTSGLEFRLVATPSVAAAVFWNQGSIEFDVRLEQNPGHIGLNVGYRESFTNQSNMNYVDVPTSTLSSAVFTHVRIPLSSLPVNCSSTADVVFNVMTGSGLIGPLVTLNDIKWTHP